LEAIRDIWSFSGVWQDFAKRAPHMAHESTAIRRGTAPLFGRNLLLTIDVRPFLSNPADTPAQRGARYGTGTGSSA
jgi:hypothetical protein